MEKNQMRLILIRHAESEHSRSGIIAGTGGCTGLTPRGIVQAEALAERLRTTGELGDCHVLLSSPVRRARQTADIVLRALPVSAVEEDSDLCELHPGAADGLPKEVYEDRYGVFDLTSYPNRPFAPDGESWAEFVERVRATQERLARQYAGRTVIAVSHAGYIVVSLLTLFAIPRPGTGARFDPIHTAITEWRVDLTGWVLERYNDASHLWHTAGSSTAMMN